MKIQRNMNRILAVMEPTASSTDKASSESSKEQYAVALWVTTPTLMRMQSINGTRC